MASELEEASIGSLAELVTKGTTPTTFGFFFQETGIPFIKVESIAAGGSLLAEKFAYISSEADVALARSRLHVNDVLFTIAGTIGRVALVPAWLGPANTNQAVAIVRPNTRKVLPQFLMYALSDPTFLNHAASRVIQGVQANFSLSELKAGRILLPQISCQRKICEVLGGIDDRIDLLRQTNTALEAIAQALFKSWFVDFDPVHAKAEGRDPEAMDAATAALFPSKFEESELGLVPKGWSSPAVYDVAQFINGAAYKVFEPNREKRGLPIIKIAELKAGVTEQTAYSDVEMPDKYRMDTGDILFSWSGNPDTSIDTFVWPSGRAWLNQHIFRVVPNISGERSFVLLALKYLKPTFAEIARNKQTTGLGHVTVSDLKRLQIAKPDEAVLQRWSLLVDPLVERAYAVQQQAQTLAELRETLLPRLISGKLRLPEAHALAEAEA